MAFKGWRQILQSHHHLWASPRGKGRTESIGDAIKSELLPPQALAWTHAHASLDRAGRRPHPDVGRNYDSPGLSPVAVPADRYAGSGSCYPV
ncbi:Uncharacterised protein [Mycobacteroides abscessus]|nr:Uncharacterised protein [Mycobacteroides abscessus]